MRIHEAAPAHYPFGQNIPNRSTLVEISKRLGRKALVQVAWVAKPETILAWYRKLVAQRFDGSVQREIVEVVVRMARENPSSDRGQHPAPARHPSCSEAQPEHELEEFHRSAKWPLSW